MPWFHCNLGNRPHLLFALIVSLGVVFGTGRLRAEQDPKTQKNLQLEVFINNVPANMISSFVQFPDGTMGATESELEELGLHTGLRRSATELVMLNEIPSLKYDYEERTQQIRITIDNGYRRGQTFDLRRDVGGRPQAGWGAVLNSGGCGLQMRGRCGF